MLRTRRNGEARSIRLQDLYGEEHLMFSLRFPSILKHLGDLAYGLQPVRVSPDGRFTLIIKMSKEAILTARLNQQIKIYLVPDILEPGRWLGLITAFFDDHDEPITLTTPLFDGDAMLRDLSILLGQDSFELYFFDEHNRELMGLIARNTHAERFGQRFDLTKFPVLDMDRIPRILDAINVWFGARDAVDDESAFTIEFGEQLYPDDYVLIDARDEAFGFHGAHLSPPVTSLEREEPGPFQERDIAALLCRAFSGDGVFLNPIREDSGTELTDVLAVNEEVILIIQAKDSPNTEAALRRSIDRKRSVIRSHVDKAAAQLRGAIGKIQEHGQVVLRTQEGPVTISVGDRVLRGLVVVREMFDDDYKRCSAPVLAIADHCRVPCVLLDYSSIHIMALHLPSPRRLINGLDQLFYTALDHGEYPKPRFLGPPVPNEAE
jgi:hypothetical protein